jgi:hypothetical protein
MQYIDFSRVHGLAVQDLAVAEPTISREAPVQCGGAYSEHPGRLIGHVAGLRPVVPGGAYDGDASRGGAEAAYGDADLQERDGEAAEGEGQHVDAVAHRVVHPGEDVGAVAAVEPAHLVRGHVRA